MAKNRHLGTGFIYFIQAGEDGPIKIGYSTDPKRRLANLQSAHSETLTVLGVIPGDLVDEQRIHKTMAVHHIRGEWYKPRGAVLDLITTALHVAILESEAKPVAKPPSHPDPDLVLGPKTDNERRECDAIEAAILQTGCTRKASFLLGCSLRTLQYRMRQYGLRRLKRGPKKRVLQPA